MTGAVADTTGDQLITARARLASCHAEIRRLRRMRWRRAWTRGRVNCELRLLLPLLRLRERIPDAFWRTFVLVIGTSVFVAIAFLATRHSSYTRTAVGGTAAIAAATITLVILLPTDGLLDRRRLVLSQVAASADYEHQNICSQLQFLCQRRDTIQRQLKLLGQQAGPGDAGRHEPPTPAAASEERVDEAARVDSNDAPQSTEQEPLS